MNGATAAPPLARSTALNFAGLVVPTLVQLVTVPLYIHRIGIDRYGVMALVWLLLGYFGFFDLGFGRAIASRVAALTATPADRAEVFWTGTALSVLAGAFGGVALYLAAQKLFANVFSVPPSLLAETGAALPYVALALPVATGISALSGALQGREAFAASNLSQIIGSILYQVLPLLVALWVSPHLPGLVIAAICGRIVSVVMLFGFCIRHVPARGRPRTSRAQARAMLGYGGWVTVTGLIYPLLTVFDRFVIGAVAGMGAVAAYTIPFNLVTRIATLPASFQNALFPRFAALDPAAAMALQARATRLVACMMTPLLVVGMLLLRPFMTFWIGPGLSLRAAPVGQILILGLWFSTLGFVPFSFLQSRGRPDVPAKLHVLELIVYAPALFYLTRHLGVAGAACAWGARNLVDTVLLFAAVRLLRGFCAAWPGLLLLAATYAMIVIAPTPAIHAAAGMVLVAASLAWAARALPPEIAATLREKFKAVGRRPAVAG